MTPSPEQKFTDEDLKRLKDEILRHREGCTCLYHPLLARMEAAELCGESLDDLLHHGVKWPNGAVHEADFELAKTRLEAWRQVAGKK